MKTLIEFKNIYLRFNNTQVFEGFNLSIEEGEKILLSGKSGKGKSSLIKMLLGYTDYNEGEIWVNKERVTEKDFTKIRHLFAYVNQDVTLQNGQVKNMLTVIESYKNNGLVLNKEFFLAPDLMRYFDFKEELLQKKVEDLSGGERQRLGLIIAIMLKRPIFLLDEVTSAIDGELKKKTVDYFSKCSETVLIISHDEVWKNNQSIREVLI